jgi:hypothetical protein
MRLPIFTVCALTLVTCLPELAAAFDHGTTSEEGTSSGKDIVTSDTPLPVGPGPGGGRPNINPDDYGMCGFLGLSGRFDPQTVARIQVGANGYYEIHREWLASNNARRPVVDWTCIRLKDFMGPLPGPEKFATKAPPPVTNSGGPRTEVQLSSGSRSFGTACIWAGVAGGISARTTDQENHSYALYDESAGAYPGVIWEGAQASKGTTITTFVFCNEFPNGDFIWNFLKTTSNFPYFDPQAFHEFLQVRPRDQWCYMQGIATTTMGSVDDPGSFVAKLGIDNSPPAPWDAGGAIYYKDVDSGGSAGLYWNCMPIQQRGF